jgi:hypothetical protein
VSRIAALSALLYAESQWRAGRINAHALADAILEHAPAIEAEAYQRARQAAALDVERLAAAMAASVEGWLLIDTEIRPAAERILAALDTEGTE